MNRLRGLLLDNLGLKFVALLLALLVYMNVYTDRPTTMLVTFRLQTTGLGDSLTLSGPAPSTVQAELHGTGKQLIWLRLSEPVIRLSLADVRPGRFTRALTAADLALPSGVELSSETSLSPGQIELQVDHLERRLLPVAARIEGLPSVGQEWLGVWRADPAHIRVAGPRAVLAGLDSVPLVHVSISAKRDSVRLRVTPVLPDWCTSDPSAVDLTVVLHPRSPR